MLTDSRELIGMLLPPAVRAAVAAAASHVISIHVTDQGQFGTRCAGSMLW